MEVGEREKVKRRILIAAGWIEQEPTAPAPMPDTDGTDTNETGAQNGGQGQQDPATDGTGAGADGQLGPGDDGTIQDDGGQQDPVNPGNEGAGADGQQDSVKEVTAPKKGKA